MKTSSVQVLFLLIACFGKLNASYEEENLFCILNDKGSTLFCSEAYLEALETFNTVLSCVEPTSVEFGTALWGRALCNLSLGDAGATYQDIHHLRLYVALISQECEGSLAALPFAKNLFFASVKFANPEERIDPAECKSRAKNIADMLRSIVAMQLDTRPYEVWNRRGGLTKREAEILKGEFFSFIEELESKAASCCSACMSNTKWTDCLTPLLERWLNWRDAGIPSDPR